MGEEKKKSELINEFMQIIASKSELQKKYLSDWNISDKEIDEFESVIGFLMEKYNYSLEFIAEAYLFINTMVMEEQYFFVKNGRYRYNNFEDVNKCVYQSEKYMTSYMVGLTISDYIWVQHIEMIRYFDKNIPKLNTGGGYLEIGPGIGQFLIRAVKSGKWREYLAVDVSPVSVEKCRSYIKYCCVDSQNIEIRLQDFCMFDEKQQYDTIVCSEVLEHVENPLGMLKKMYSILASDGRAFVTTVINAPMIDHIYLYSSVQEVLSMATEAGFKICDYLCAAAGNVSLEKAKKRKTAICIAMIMEK